jgi:chemotaxis protein MotB
MKLFTTKKFTTLCLIVALTGCVSAKKHEKQLAEKDAEIQNLESARTELKTSLEDLKKAYAEMQARRAEEQKRLQEFRDLTAKFKKLIDAGKLKVKMVDGKMVVSLGSDILFPSGSAKLSAAGLSAIQEVTKQLAAIENRQFQIEGHTDNAPIKSPSYTNWDLASARALTVLKTMTENGMPANRISAASFADTKPIADNSSEKGRAQNRRIEIVVVPDLSSLPGYDELNKIGGGK